jgi:adenine-specific DNA methylase
LPCKGSTLVSYNMSAEWCSEILKTAIEKHGKPEIFNTDYVCID